MYNAKQYKIVGVEVITILAADAWPWISNTSIYLKQLALFDLIAAKQASFFNVDIKKDWMQY